MSQQVMILNWHAATAKRPARNRLLLSSFNEHRVVLIGFGRLCAVIMEVRGPGRLPFSPG
jgi:hypothetical protein